MAQGAQAGAAAAAAQRCADLDRVTQPAQCVCQLRYRQGGPTLGCILARKAHMQQEHVLCKRVQARQECGWARCGRIITAVLARKGAIALQALTCWLAAKCRGGQHVLH